MQRLQREKRLPRGVAVGHHDEVDIATIGFELSERDGTLEIESDEAASKDGLHVGQEEIEQRVDVRVLRRVTTQRASDSKTGRMLSRAARRFASELA